MQRTYREIIHHDYYTAILPEIKIIDGKYPYSRGYDCLSLIEFLRQFLPNGDYFIDKERITLFNNYLDTVFPGFRGHIDKYEFLKKNQLLPEASRIDIGQLKFYQDEINIDRLDKLAGEDYFNRPVIIVRFENDLILYDGYHRTLISFLDGINHIDCYTL